jgi:hypothetical protein
MYQRTVMNNYQIHTTTLCLDRFRLLDSHVTGLKTLGSSILVINQ